MNAEKRGLDGIVAGVLAGERPGPSELSEAEKVALKVLIDIDGRPMLARVLDVVQRSLPDRVPLIAGPDDERLPAAGWLVDAIENGRVTRVGAAPSPSRSARALVKAGLAGGAAAVAITTGDHPLLTPETFRCFIADALATDAEAVVGLADYTAVKDAFPASRRTALRFSDGFRCGCNLFLFRGAGAMRVLDFWQEVEQERKRPDRILRRLGAGLAVRYLAGRLPLADAVAQLGRITSARIATVLVPDPDAAVDVDNLEDLATVRARWAARVAQDSAALGPVNT